MKIVIFLEYNYHFENDRYITRVIESLTVGQLLNYI